MFIFKRLELDIDTARDRAHGGVVGLGGSSRVGITGIEALSFGPVINVFAGEINTEFADAELLGDFRRNGISEVDVLQVQVAGVEQETIGLCVLILILVLLSLFVLLSVVLSLIEVFRRKREAGGPKR